MDTVSRTLAGPTASGSLGRSGEDVRVSGDGVRAAPAELNAGGSITIGAGKDATLEGTRVNAGEDILVEADNIFVRPGAESDSQQTEARHEWAGIRQEGNSVGGGASLGVDTADIEQTSGAGAQLAAGGDVDLIAEDALRIEGSDVAAGNDVRLEGSTVDILAFQGDYSEVHDGEQIGGEVGITAGGEGGTIGYYVEVEGGQNDLVRDDQQHRNSRITAGERLEVVSRDDTTIAGANLTGNELDLDVGGDLLVSSVQDEGAVDGQRWDGKLRVTVGAGVSVSGSAGYGETEGEKAWVADQTRLIGRERVDIDTAGHTQVDGAVIANIREDGSDGGNLSLTTDTLAVTDIHDSHTEDSHYTRISGSWESEKAYQSRGANSDYTQTTGKPRGDETGDTFDERTTWGIEGSYSSLDREQINRGTLGQGEITVHHPDSDLNTELADINRDIDRAQEITRDESETTELYVTETSVEDTEYVASGQWLEDLKARQNEIAMESLTAGFVDADQVREYAEALEECEAQGNCDEVIQTFRDLSLQQQREFYEYCEGNPSGCMERYGYLTEEYDDFLSANLDLSQADYRPHVPALNDKHVFDMQYEEVKDYLVLTGRAQDLGLNSEETEQYVDQQGVVLTGLSAISGGGLIGRSARGEAATNTGAGRSPWTQVSSDSRAIVRDVEGHSGISIPQGQRSRLAEEVRSRDHTVPASDTEYSQLQRQYNNNRANLRREWEQNTGRTWPKDSNGNNYQAHHVIPSRYGGPNEWWNLHPVPRSAHQSGVHGTGSPTQGTFPTPVSPQ